MRKSVIHFQPLSGFYDESFQLDFSFIQVSEARQEQVRSLIGKSLVLYEQVTGFLSFAATCQLTETGSTLQSN
jgi:hypothetical protein